MRLELNAGNVKLGPNQTLRVVDGEGTTVCAVEGAVHCVADLAAQRNRLALNERNADERHGAPAACAKRSRRRRRR